MALCFRDSRIASRAPSDSKWKNINNTNKDNFSCLQLLLVLLLLLVFLCDFHFHIYLYVFTLAKL